MTFHDEYLTFQTKQAREIINMTDKVRVAVEKSGIQNGLILVTSLHSNAAVFVTDDEPGLLEDIGDWMASVAPVRDDYKHGRTGESNAGVHLQALLLRNQAVLSLNSGKIELGPWQQVFYAELDGGRPKRVLVKILGERDQA